MDRRSPAVQPGRLRGARDIATVFASGTGAHGSAMSVHARDRGSGTRPRAAVIASRKVGSAVRRNRARRRLRAALAVSDLPRTWDIVVVAKSPAIDLEFEALTTQLGSLSQRIAGRLRDGG